LVAREQVLEEFKKSLAAKMICEKTNNISGKVGITADQFEERID